MIIDKAYIYIPFNGIQNILFGMDRVQIREILGDQPDTFLRNQYAENTTDYYKRLGIFILYDKNDFCQAIEFVKENILLYHERDLFKYKFSDLVKQFNPLSQKLEVEENLGVTYYDLGFGATKSNRNDDIESIIIFSNSYWDT